MMQIHESNKDISVSKEHVHVHVHVHVCGMYH